MTSSHHLLQAMYWSCADTLALAAHIPDSSDLPQAPELRQRIAALLDQMAIHGAERGLTRDDIEDARYAVVALLDEQLLHSSWSGKLDWMLEPLQLTYYNENTAGEGFFKRLAAIESRPERVHVLQVYYLCLALGFQGMYSVKPPDARKALVEGIAAKLASSLSSNDVISPHGVPPDLGRKRTGRQLPVVPMAIGLLVLALLTFVGLKIAISTRASNAASSMQEAATRMTHGSGREQGR